MHRLRLPAVPDVVKFVAHYVFHFDYDDAAVDRACHDINDLIDNFFYLHPPAVNHLLDDVYDDAVNAHGVSGDP